MSKENIYLLYGPPGSGKSTLAKELSTIIGYGYISIGELTRSEIAKDTPRGRALKKCLDDVVEYPTGLISGLVEDRLNQNINSKGFIIDGYPKYPNEAHSFVAMVKKNNLNVNTIAVIKLSLEEALSRTINRRICASCLSQTKVQDDKDVACPSCGGKLAIREDDRPEILTRRYNDFGGSINDVLRILENLNPKIHMINGILNQEEMIQEAMKAFEYKPE